MTVTVLLFARLRELVGSDRVRLEITAGSVGAVRAALAERHPRATGLIVRSATAVNGEYVANDCTVGPDDEIALIPPVSGG